MERDPERDGASSPGWTAWSRRTVAAAPRQASCSLSGEAVVLHLDSGVYYGLDEVGALVWQRIRQPGGAPTVTELRDAVLDAFDVDAPTCEADLLDLLASMQRAGLIEVGG